MNVTLSIDLKVPEAYNLLDPEDRIKLLESIQGIAEERVIKAIQSAVWRNTSVLGGELTLSEDEE